MSLILVKVTDAFENPEIALELNITPLIPQNIPRLYIAIDMPQCVQTKGTE